jgi:hypothetical protein
MRDLYFTIFGLNTPYQLHMRLTRVCFGLIPYSHLAWLEVACLAYLPCRNWCNIIIIITPQAAVKPISSSNIVPALPDSHVVSSHKVEPQGHRFHPRPAAEDTLLCVSHDQVGGLIKASQQPLHETKTENKAHRTLWPVQ